MTNHYLNTPKNINYHLGPMREVSLVGKTGEEAGANFSEYNRLLETKIPLLQHILPWGAMSVIKDAKQSDDGPIWWVRPGEQRYFRSGIHASEPVGPRYRWCGAWIPDFDQKSTQQ